VNVKGTPDTPYVAFTGDRIDTFRASSSEARKVAPCEFGLVADTDAVDVRVVAANNTKLKMNAQTSNKTIFFLLNGAIRLNFLHISQKS
jgi:hypothetical protein